MCDLCGNLCGDVWWWCVVVVYGVLSVVVVVCGDGGVWYVLYGV